MHLEDCPVAFAFVSIRTTASSNNTVFPLPVGAIDTLRCGVHIKIHYAPLIT